MWVPLPLLPSHCLWPSETPRIPSQPQQCRPGVGPSTGAKCSQDRLFGRVIICARRCRQLHLFIKPILRGKNCRLSTFFSSLVSSLLTRCVLHGTALYLVFTADSVQAEAPTTPSILQESTSSSATCTDASVHPDLSEVRDPWISFHLNPCISSLLALLELRALVRSLI